MQATKVARTGSAIFDPVEAAAWCAVAIASIDGSPSSTDETLITGLIDDVQSTFEETLGRCLTTATFTLTLDREDLELPDGTLRDVILLDGRPGPVIPLVSVQSVKVYDENDVESTLSATTDYLVLTGEHAGRITLRNGISWPSSMRPYSCVAIALTAGYGDTGASVPGLIRLSCKEAISYWYRNPGDGFVTSPVGNVQALPPHIMTLLGRLRACGYGRPGAIG
jgi:uncharacterized phiE125 gp8 family phage protein